MQSFMLLEQAQAVAGTSAPSASHRPVAFGFLEAYEPWDLSLVLAFSF